MNDEIMKEIQVRREKREAERRALVEEMKKKTLDRQRRVSYGTTQDILKDELEYRCNQARMIINETHSAYDVDHTGGSALELRREIARGHLEGMRDYIGYKNNKK